MALGFGTIGQFAIGQGPVNPSEFITPDKWQPQVPDIHIWTRRYETLPSGMTNGIYIPAPAWVLSAGGFDASVDMKFDAGLYYSGSVIPAAVTSLLSITRASPATTYAQTAGGVLVPFAANTLRITNLGLLVEEARTNLALQSQTFQTTWTPENTTISADQTTAPDGTLTADLMTENTATNVHDIYIASGTFVSGSTYTYSLYVKPGTNRYVTLTVQGPADRWYAAVFDLQGGGSTATQTATGVVQGTVVSTSQTAVANGFYRISLSGSLPQTSGFLIIAQANAATGNTFNSGGQTSYTGASRTVSIWGAQFELGTFATSYIPTTSASVARSADVVTASGALLANLQLAAGSLVAQTNLVAQLSANNPRIVGTNSAGSFKDWLNFQSTLRISTYNGSALLSTANSVTAAGAVKSGVAWDASGRSVVANAGAVATDANLLLSNALTPVIGGGDNSATEYLDGYIARLTVWNSRLPDAALKAMTQ